MVQVQSRSAAMVTVPLPPFELKLGAEAVALTWHLSALGATSDEEVCAEVHAAENAAAATGTTRTSRQNTRYGRAMTLPNGGARNLGELWAGQSGRPSRCEILF